MSGTAVHGSQLFMSSIVSHPTPPGIAANSFNKTNKNFKSAEHPARILENGRFHRTCSVGDPINTSGEPLC